jgi:hypothetical protein
MALALTILQRLYRQGHLTFYDFLRKLNQLGYPDISERLIRHTDLSPQVLQEVIREGYLDLVEPLVKFGFKIRQVDLNRSLVELARRGANELVQYLLTHGATAIESAQQAALDENHPSTVELLEQYRHQ